MRRPRVRGRGDRGQVALEFTGMVPLILLTLALLWQVVLVGYAYTLAANAADEAVRACAVGEDGEAAGTRHLGGAWEGDAGCGAVSGGMVTAVATVRIPVLFPGTAGFADARATAGAVYEVSEGTGERP
ncbi:TadE/TadG family type IV pilus assembly protein [Streptomyces filamentosus]|uniref:Septum formation initiator n=1 Tax=Streptomyces filamentosus TaxID=67294 RepID=A0A919EJ82_STRFL|nr:TadE/TadG family type IV pilus assembly protein [Streptomyces filamentosus]KAA6219426.1 pilus assembly protein [Streptomyces filamentosus]GHF87005.1 septum formation initiator [Streptomyces filamentosus]